MRQLNIIGTIGKDGAEWSPGRSGDFLSFSVATSNGKNKDGSYKPSTYVNCTIFDNKFANSMEQYLTAGTKVFIQGECSSNAWIDRNGKPQSSINCTISKLELVGNKLPDTTQQPTTDQQANASNASAQHLPPDDAPF